MYNVNNYYKNILLICIIICPVFGSYISNDQLKDKEQKNTGEDKTIDADKEINSTSISSIFLKIYTGSKEQNKALIKAGGFEGVSIVDALKAIGANSDYESRKILYQDTFTKLSEGSNDIENKLLKRENKELQQICYMYIDSNFMGLPIFINENFSRHYSN